MLHKILQYTGSLMVLLFISYSFVYAQGGPYGGGHFHPDSLSPVTVSGTAIVDSTQMPHPVYFLDENGDGSEDYILNFGPFWYQPDSSNATRPQDGESVTIEGGLRDSTMTSLPMIVVYDINGDFWREPFEPMWAFMGQHSHSGMHHQGGFTGFAFGWMHDSLSQDTVNGTALVDTTFVFEHYYLDENGDDQPDYLLNFGPFWYEPTSGATRPEHGDQLTIVGSVLNRTTLPMVLVFEMNGQIWRDSTSFGPHFGGGWFHKNMGTPRMIHAPFDTSDWVMMNPGWHHGGGHHGMADSLFGQMLQLFPQNIPNTGNQRVFAGYEVGMFLPGGMNGMWQNGPGGHMNFSSNSQFQLHYNEIQQQGFNIDENTIKAKYWDSHSGTWVEATGATVDPVNNTVTFSNNQVSSFVILTGDELTSIPDKQETVAQQFTLKQNYPNPFNPETTIEFSLQQKSDVILSVYNTLGQKLFDILNKPLAAGVHTVQFDAGALPSGIYFYRLKVGDDSQIRKMTLMR